MYTHTVTSQTQINHDVRPDSNLILHAAQAVTEEEGFDDLLQGVRDRVDEIESLHRTRELTVSSHFFFTRVKPRFAFTDILIDISVVYFF